MTNNEERAKEICDLLVANGYLAMGDYTSAYLVTAGVLNRNYPDHRDAGPAGKKVVIRDKEGAIVAEQG